MLPKPICINDYGEEVYTCRYTNKPILASEVKVTGGFIPGVHATYFMASSKEDVSEMRLSRHNFDISEANCNTCANLIRVTHAKIKGGFLKGSCHLDSNLYFHPDDPLHKTCYVARKLKQ